MFSDHRVLRQRVCAQALRDHPPQAVHLRTYDAIRTNSDPSKLQIQSKGSKSYFSKIFFGVPHLATWTLSNVVNKIWT